MGPPEQLPFDLGHRQAYEREDFWVSDSNKEAVALLDRWPEFPSHAVVLLGAQASGKTHLLQVWKQEAQAVELDVHTLDGALPMDIVTGKRHIAIDDTHAVIGHEAAERALLHIYNAVKDEGHSMVLCCEKPIKNYEFKVPDLRSRLMAAPVAMILPPDEDLMAVVLTKMFSDRQIFVSQEVVQFIITRIERSFSAIRELVERLDRKALANKKSVTIPLVKEVL